MTGVAGDMLRRTRDDLSRLLGRRVGVFLHDGVENISGEVVGSVRRYQGPEELGGRLIAAADRGERLPAYRGVAGDDIPGEIHGLMSRLRATGVDEATAAQVERAVLERYRTEFLGREVAVRRDFLHSTRFAISRRGETEAGARRLVDDYLRDGRTRELIAHDAGARTGDWADRIELPSVLRESAAGAPRPGPFFADGTLRRLAGRAELEHGPLPESLQRAAARIADSGAERDAVDQATRLLRERYETYRSSALESVYRRSLLDARAGFARQGFSSDVVDRLAPRQAEAFTQSEKAQRIVDGIASRTTDGWFRQVETVAARDGDTLADRLARTFRYQQAPLTEPELGAATARIEDMGRSLDTTQRHLDELLAKSPELAEKTGRWQSGIDTHRGIVDRLSDLVHARSAAGEPITRSMVNDALLHGPEANIRGYEGEIRMATRLDGVSDLGAPIDVVTPAGVRLTGEVDVVTGDGRVWHEVKTNDPASQASARKDLEAQVRRHLVISHSNPEYWVDGEPPQLKLHFVNGVDPEVRSSIEAIRIEDETGRVVADHRVEVVDES
ncbi:hypothetical protein [Nocardia sp. alder85J]|uniref:hypothetical protein n=1 Tax=Nocardia sp. alder85J TaxID=2862949 RepID=UPI001CD7A654|nr:hypothetical protein [Nocardia sp. alder85J]MCX4092969.1 hypothetical protein [Nocardia sp. alder85J]